MVRGLDVFSEHFAGHADQFVLIGGTAATLAMEEAGLEFRATKDLDIVLHIEALNPSFGEVFWRFVEAGATKFGRPARQGGPCSIVSRSQLTNAFLPCSSCSAEPPMASSSLKTVASRQSRSTRPLQVCQPSCLMTRITNSSLQVARKVLACRGSARTG